MRFWMAAKTSLSWFFGLLFLLVVVGGVAGMVLPTSYSGRVGCWPYYSVFGVIETECESSLVAVVWLVTVELPRLFYVFPAVALKLLSTAAAWDEYSSKYAMESLPWLGYSLVDGALLWPGFRFWWKRIPYLAVALAGLFAGQLIWLATRS